MASPATASSTKPKVVVTGAGGKTGKLVVERLAAAPDAWAPPVAVVRSAKSGAPAKAAGADVVIIDVTAPGAGEALEAALTGADGLIIATSAVPQIKTRSIVRLMVAKLLKQAGVRPEFRRWALVGLQWGGACERDAVRADNLLQPKHLRPLTLSYVSLVLSSVLSLVLLFA